jgi:hypothetical protein
MLLTPYFSVALSACAETKRVLLVLAHALDGEACLFERLPGSSGFSVIGDTQPPTLLHTPARSRP